MMVSPLSISNRFQKLSIPSSQDTSVYAIVQVMHQTVREFFLRPHGAVVQSPFRVANIQEAQMMIQLTCVRYLSLHFDEIISEEVDFNWCPIAGDCEFVKYLDNRPFVKYSLQCLTRQRDNINSEVVQIHSDLICRIHESLEFPALCLLNN
jgi:hypothetical protein